MDCGISETTVSKNEIHSFMFTYNFEKLFFHNQNNLPCFITFKKDKLHTKDMGYSSHVLSRLAWLEIVTKRTVIVIDAEILWVEVLLQ